MRTKKGKSSFPEKKRKLKIQMHRTMEMIKQFKVIHGISFLAMAYCAVCIFFKCSASFNVSEKIRPMAEGFLNISYSIIAAYIFFIFQVIVPAKQKKDLFKQSIIHLCQQIINISSAIEKQYNKLNDDQDFHSIITSLSSKNGKRIQDYQTDIKNLFELLQELENLIQSFSEEYVDILNDDFKKILLDIKESKLLRSLHIYSHDWCEKDKFTIYDYRMMQKIFCEDEITKFKDNMSKFEEAYVDLCI